MIPALVLTAGLATRLRPLSYVRAKAALPVAGEPLVRRILGRLVAAGVDDVVLNLHHLPHTLTAVAGDGADLGMRIRYSWEHPRVLGTAGGPRHALPLINAPTFLVVNGDTLTDAAIEGIVSHHADTGALVTIAVVPNTTPERYSGLAVNEGGAVTGVVERGSSRSSFHVIGIQVVESRAFAELPDNQPHESIGSLYPRLWTQSPGSVRAWLTSAEFMDIGTPGDYLDTSRLLASREGRDLTGHARIARTARVVDSILWDDVEVEGGAMLRECVVTDGVRVPADTSWRGVTIRLATGDLAPGERRIGGLAICSL